VCAYSTSPYTHPANKDKINGNIKKSTGKTSKKNVDYISEQAVAR